MLRRRKKNNIKKNICVNSNSDDAGISPQCEETNKHSFVGGNIAVEEEAFKSDLPTAKHDSHNDDKKITAGSPAGNCPTDLCDPLKYKEKSSNSILGSQQQTSKNGKPTSEPTAGTFHSLHDPTYRGKHGSTVEDRTLFEAKNNGKANIEYRQKEKRTSLIVGVEVDIAALVLLLLAFLTRFYKLSYPRHVVFDELHYGKSVSHYIRNVFYFDQQPPLGKQIIAAVAEFIGYDGNYTASYVGARYPDNFPVFWMRFVPALCGSLLPNTVFLLLKEMEVSRWYCILGGLLIVLDNAILTQSRFILLEPLLLLFSTLGLYFLIKFLKATFPRKQWIIYGFASAFSLAIAICTKFSGFYTYALAVYLILRYLNDLLLNPFVTDCYIATQAAVQWAIFTIIPLAVYVGSFYLHLETLYKAGPHDSILTSAFQASLEGGLAAITRNQPQLVAHGSQITLRHTHGRRCWLHSHPHLYPVRYPDERGSSHQQQVTCYPFKDVNNWWIVKRPDVEDVVVSEEPDFIKHGDIIQLVHGITSRALNSHDVAAPVTPQCQEVSCYIDYNINMNSELLWKVDIINKDTDGDIWKTITSEVRLLHVTTGAVLKFSGRVLPEWGFNQHEVVADRSIDSNDAIWNVEEHRYTKDADQGERGRKMAMAEMIPTEVTKLSFVEKFIELNMKMFLTKSKYEDHMFSSDPIEWPLLWYGVAYWLDPKSNKQIHLLGNVLLWCTATSFIFIYLLFLVFYLLRRQRLFYDIDDFEWQRFTNNGHVFVLGYFINYVPYFLEDKEHFLHHYLPAFVLKIQLMVFTMDHIDKLFQKINSFSFWLTMAYRFAVLSWLVGVIIVYVKFLPLSYGTKDFSPNDFEKMRWISSWDFVTHRSNNKIRIV